MQEDDSESALFGIPRRYAISAADFDSEVPVESTQSVWSRF